MAGRSADKHPPRILVVDDHADNLTLMREILARQGYHVATAESAEAAEREMRRHPPDVVLLDVLLPGKSGFELCRELKSDSATRLIPVVLITGLADRDSRIRGIQLGADDFLSKPVYPEELLARVQSLARLKGFTDELDHVSAVLCALGLSVESRDPYTEGHCERLADYAGELGRVMGLDEDSVIALQRGGYLHDLGKIAIPDEVLKKGADLTPSEWKIMKQHPLIGERICQPLRSLRRVLPIIRHHHEHWDGSGYPDGLRGEKIPLLARILQVVDIYDALRTSRPYKPAKGHAEAVEVMRQEARSGLWDAGIVEQFIALSEGREKAA